MTQPSPELPETPTVEEFGKYLVHQGLGLGDSVITPGTPIWTVEHCDELIRDFVDRPDAGSGNFFEKLAGQLDDSSDGAIQLFAEIYVLNVLPLSNVGGELKAIQAEQILEMMSSPPSLPKQVIAGLAAKGAFNGGRAFTSQRWAQIGYLIQVIRTFLERDETTRLALLADPLKFREAVDSVRTTQRAQRQSVLYIAFPEFYVPSISDPYRKKIRTAFADEYLGHQPTDDLDRDLYEIRVAMEESTGGPVDFYSSGLRPQWDKQDSAPGPVEPSDEVRKAWKVYGSNVNGQDLAPIWSRERFVSLSANPLRPIEPDINREELRQVVEEDYRNSSHSTRSSKFDDIYSFLARMHTGDLIVTVSQGKVHFGKVAGDATHVRIDDHRAELRRPATWSATVDIEDLPATVTSLINRPDHVVDLSSHLTVLDTIAAGSVHNIPKDRQHLRDADESLATQLHVPQTWLQECIELLRDRPQLIFYGPPGTGKTYIAQKLAEHLAGENVRLVQFHPAYSYEDFFEGYRPTQFGSGQVGFDLRPGPLRRLVDKAQENPDAVFILIIDEINRGNLAKIFGELYFLLEYRDAGIDLLYGSDSTEQFSLPRNIIMLGTMNTADRSIALVDAAMRRRFSFVSMHPSEEPTNQILRNWLARNGRDAEFADLLDELNERIDDNDFKIGPSYFMRNAVAKPGGLERMWRTSIMPLLEEFHYGDRNIDVAGRYGLAAIRRAIAAKAAAAPVNADSPGTATVSDSTTDDNPADDDSTTLPHPD